MMENDFLFYEVDVDMYQEDYGISETVESNLFRSKSYDEVNEVCKLRETDLQKFIEIGKKNYDEHFEKMLEVEETHRLEIFEYYIEECMGWKIEPIVYDFEFEW